MPTSLQGDDVVAARTENGAYYFTSLKNGMEKAVLSKDRTIYTLATEANWDTTSYAHYWSGLEDPKSLVLTPVDYYFQKMGAYGSCDMGENVNEWIMRSNEKDPFSPFPVTRGGSWASTYFAPNQLGVVSKRPDAHSSCTDI